MNLAAALATGDGVRQNLRRAAKLYRKLSEDGSGEATYNLATMYMLGEGVPRSWARAVKLFRLAERDHHSDASIVLGELSLKGAPLIRKSRGAALEHFIRAIHAGDLRGLEWMAKVVQLKPKMTAEKLQRALLSVSKRLRQDR
jgi:TPR repeat protein